MEGKEVAEEKQQSSHLDEVGCIAAASTGDVCQTPGRLELRSAKADCIALADFEILSDQTFAWKRKPP